MPGVLMALVFLPTQAWVLPWVLPVELLTAAVIGLLGGELTRAWMLAPCSSVPPWGVGGGPELSVTATVAPGWASKPGGASWERTLPSGTVSLCCWPVVLIRRPTPESAALASSKVIPERSGTGTNFEAGPGFGSGLGAGAGAEACAKLCCPTRSVTGCRAAWVCWCVSCRRVCISGGSGALRATFPPPEGTGALALGTGPCHPCPTSSANGLSSPKPTPETNSIKKVATASNV